MFVEMIAKVWDDDDPSYSYTKTPFHDTSNSC